MAWTAPEFTRDAINNAGKQLASDPSELTSSQFNVLNNFRASHGFPLNTIQMRLRDKANQVHKDSVVNQRLKRRQSIAAKLIKMDSLKLSNMQDIGGCRAVTPTVDHVVILADEFKAGRARHLLIKENDYVAAPKPDGYRSLHLVYAYQSDKTPTYNGMKIEIQLRSELQHAWAMAVETFDSITRQSLKTGTGDPTHLRFFALLSSWFAIRESRPPVPNTPVNAKDLSTEILDIDDELKIVSKFNGYRAALRILSDPQAKRDPGWYILHLDLELRTINAMHFDFRDYGSALSHYQSLEDDHANDINHDVVLVSTGTSLALTRAYPSYFGIASRFLDEIRPIVEP